MRLTTHWTHTLGAIDRHHHQRQSQSRPMLVPWGPSSPGYEGSGVPMNPRTQPPWRPTCEAGSKLMGDVDILGTINQTAGTLAKAYTDAGAAQAKQSQAELAVKAQMLATRQQALAQKQQAGLSRTQVALAVTGGVVLLGALAIIVSRRRSRR